MNLDTFNTKIKIPTLHTRNPHAMVPPEFDAYRGDPLLDDPIEAEALREGWSGGLDTSDTNYFSNADVVGTDATHSIEGADIAALEEEDAHYGAKLGGLAVGLESVLGEEDHDTDEQKDLEDNHDE